MSDLDWMSYALAIAERGRGFVEPNPLVGAVVVRQGGKVGEGWHEKFGEAHAEVNAINQAGVAARGATLYVTLEPCCHFGKTPPCTDAIIRAGIQRVVAAMMDPFPSVSGGGFRVLRQAGIEVVAGVLEDRSRELNAPYLTLVSKTRPYVHGKWAMSLDGKIATRTGHSKWISGEESRRRVHELRGRMDAIIVGAGTVRADDPQLTARPPGPRTPLRVVLTAQGLLPENCQLLQSAREVPVLIAGPRNANTSRHEQMGCEVIAIESVEALLAELGRRRFTNVLIEGGAGVLGAFHEARMIDEAHVFLAPILVGGASAISPMRGLGVETIGEALRSDDVQIEPLGPDFYIRARFRSRFN